MIGLFWLGHNNQKQVICLNVSEAMKNKGQTFKNKAKCWIMGYLMLDSFGVGTLVSPIL